MKLRLTILLFGLILFISNCTVPKNSSSSTSKDDGMIDFTFLQINDVYEIAPLEGGKKGGMARVATLKNCCDGAKQGTIG